jgi:hypothetical protein
MMSTIAERAAEATDLHFVEVRMVVDDECWWYECKAGVSIVVRHTANGTVEYKIPWRQLRAALKRKDQKQ